MNKDTQTKQKGFFEGLKNALLFLPRFINRKLKIKITYKTTFLYALVYVLIAAFIALFAYFSVDNSIKSRHVTDALSRITHLAEYYDQNGLESFDDISNIAGGVVVIASGNTIVKQNGMINIEAIKDNRSEGHYYNDEKVTAYRAAKIRGVDYTIFLEVDISTSLESLHLLGNILLLTTPLGLVLLVGLGSLASAGMLKPIKKINEGIKSITAESLETRIASIDSQDELTELIGLLNEMLDSLENSFMEQSRFVSDASHELRTPIAVIQGYSNLLERWGKTDPSVLDEAITAIGKESENMKNLVDKLLFLARSETLAIKSERFVLSELIEEIARETTLTAAGKTKKIEIVRLEPVEVVADRELIKQALRVFVDNSVKYTGEDGNIKLSCYSDDDRAVLRVKDNGMGIPDADMPYIFERFYRCDQARNRNSGSSGLGLSIAKWIVDTHDGAITVNSSLGKGTEISVYLAAAEEE